MLQAIPARSILKLRTIASSANEHINARTITTKSAITNKIFGLDLVAQYMTQPNSDLIKFYVTSDFIIFFFIAVTIIF